MSKRSQEDSKSTTSLKIRSAELQIIASELGIVSNQLQGLGNYIQAAGSAIQIGGNFTQAHGNAIGVLSYEYQLAGARLQLISSLQEDKDKKEGNESPQCSDIVGIQHLRERQREQIDSLYCQMRSLQEEVRNLEAKLHELKRILDRLAKG